MTQGDLFPRRSVFLMPVIDKAFSFVPRFLQTLRTELVFKSVRILLLIPKTMIFAPG
jgi:hypothetical protein